ncbi:hypothetical protein ETAA8_61330 [Anatilimnocola aggregata]|uniref:Uncharacterized protein n=1 Tax=Anatilimnocola aggregata TaxID=2528021 RepID=A0A517YLA3_9BACT|nr:hypothetical protein ETAA8_61330 [Anatilimnocola aggregata]
MLYVGSYLALVVPAGRIPVVDDSIHGIAFGKVYHYRVDGDWAKFVYWPLEQIDRKVRPGAWELPWERVWK